MKTNHSSPYKFMMLAVVIIPVILFAFIAWLDYNTTISNANQDVTRTVKIFEQHALNVFETHQLIAERVNDRLTNMSWEEIERSTEISSFLEDIGKKYPQVTAVWLADSSGVVRNASKKLPDEQVTVTDRDYYQVLSKNNAIDFYIGHVVKPRVMTSLNFNIAYRRGDKGNKFDGVIILTASPEYFSKFWNTVASQNVSSAVLLRSDGAVLSRSRGIDPNRLNLDAYSRPMQEIKKANEGSYISESLHDGIERIYGFRKVDRFNAFIIYGEDMTSVLRIWKKHIVIYGCFFSTAMLIFVLFTLSSQRHANKLQASEEALRESENIYRAIGESIDYGIWICDADGHNLYASESFLNLVGITQEQCSKSGWVDILHPDDAENSITSWERCLQTENALDIEHRFRGTDGLWHPILARGVPVRDESGRIINWAGINLDISRSRQAEDELKKLNAELDLLVEERTQELKEKNLLLIHQSRLAAMGEMIQNIAHQWRQPLNTLGMKIQSLQMFHDAGKLDREFLDKTVNSTMSLILHMSKTIDDFRGFFKPDKDKVEFKVAQVIESAIQLVEASFENCHIKIDMNCMNETVAFGYPNEYSQVILNILINAKDALLVNKTVNPKVTIISCMEADRSVVTISDNAGGIPENCILKIFEPHFTTKGSQGTGIGLFMAKNIIEKNMNGKLSVRNNEVGAEFRIEV